MEHSTLLNTIKDAYNHNWVVELDLKAKRSITGMINTYVNDGHFYLTHQGDIEEINLADLDNVKVIDEKWWQTAAKA